MFSKQVNTIVVLRKKLMKRAKDWPALISRVQSQERIALVACSGRKGDKSLKKTQTKVFKSYNLHLTVLQTHRYRPDHWSSFLGLHWIFLARQVTTREITFKKWMRPLTFKRDCMAFFFFPSRGNNFRKFVTTTSGGKMLIVITVAMLLTLTPPALARDCSPLMSLLGCTLHPDLTEEVWHSSHDLTHWNLRYHHSPTDSTQRHWNGERR